MPSFEYEIKYSSQTNLPIHNAIGVDEVGRGCLAGDVIATALMLKPNIPESLLAKINDSKKLSAKSRETIANLLSPYCIFAFGSASVVEIDNLNILQASLLAMTRAVNLLSSQIEYKNVFVLVDGNQLPKLDYPSFSIVSGDAKSYSIACASIFAKVYRDRRMQELSKLHPQYNWEKNAGYGTKKHLEAINNYGITKYHRASFAPIKYNI